MFREYIQHTCSKAILHFSFEYIKLYNIFYINVPKF